MVKRISLVTAAALVAASAAMAQPVVPKKEKKHDTTVQHGAQNGQNGQSGSQNEQPKNEQEAPTLKVGDKAPALSIEEWVKGDKIAAFEPGKVYVVEFWATWCGPCRESIPHLTKLQKDYKDKGVTFVGVDSSEREPKPGAKDERLDNVKKFVREQGDKMVYTVAYDADRSMSKAWLQAAGVGTIPTAFVVGKDGKIAWIGHPGMGLDDAVKAAAGAKDVKRSASTGAATIILASQPEKSSAQSGEKAQPEKAKKKKAVEPTTTLFVGDKAPELTVSKWVKGEPVTGYEKGKNYVVEFWATWCGPCKESIPHLTELQKENKNVRFIGVSIWESDQKNVEPFVKDMGDKMDYTVAMDEVPEDAGKNPGMEGKMAKNWMASAGQNAIPTAFIVNGEGRIAWIGHPAALEDTLKKVADGTYDLEKASAEYRHQKQTEEKMRPLQRKLSMAASTGDIDAALEACDAMLELDPKAEFAPGRPVSVMKFGLLLKEKKDYDKAYAYGSEIVDGALKDNDQALNEIAWTIVDPDGPDLEKHDLKLAMRAAQRAFDLTKQKDGMIADTLAKVYHDQGELTKAIELQEKAVKLMEESKFKGSQFDDDIKNRLEEYQEEAKKKGG